MLDLRVLEFQPQLIMKKRNPFLTKRGGPTGLQLDPCTGVGAVPELWELVVWHFKGREPCGRIWLDEKASSKLRHGEASTLGTASGEVGGGTEAGF